MGTRVIITDTDNETRVWGTVTSGLAAEREWLWVRIDGESHPMMVHHTRVQWTDQTTDTDYLPTATPPM